MRCNIAAPSSPARSRSSTRARARWLAAACVVGHVSACTPDLRFDAEAVRQHVPLVGLGRDVLLQREEPVQLFYVDHRELPAGLGAVTPAAIP